MGRKKKRNKVNLVRRILPDGLTTKNAIWGLLWLFVASLLTTMLSDFFTLCKVVVFSSSSHLWDKVVDSFFELMAQSSTLDLAFEASLTWKFICILVFTYGSSKMFRRARVMEGFVEEFKATQNMSSGEFRKYKEKVSQERALQRKKSAKAFSKFGKFQMWFGIIYLILFHIQILTEMYINIRVKAFQKDLAILRPTISDLEYYTLKKDWVLIKTKSDYVSLQDKISVLKERAEPSTGSDNDHVQQN